MSTTTRPTSAAADRAPSTAAPLGARRRGEKSPGARVATHGALAVASLTPLFPVSVPVLLPLGPDQDDRLPPGRIVGKITFDNYVFVLRETKFFDWLWSTLVVSLGTTVIGVLVAATTGYAVSRMRFPGYKKFMWVLLVTQ